MELSSYVQPITRSTLKIKLTLTADFHGMTKSTAINKTFGFLLRWVGLRFCVCLSVSVSFILSFFLRGLVPVIKLYAWRVLGVSGLAGACLACQRGIM